MYVFIYNSPKLETTQISFSGWMDKQNVYSYDWKILKNKKKWTTHIHKTSMNLHCMLGKWKKPYPKAVCLYFIFVTFCEMKGKTNGKQISGYQEWMDDGGRVEFLGGWWCGDDILYFCFAVLRCYITICVCQAHRIVYKSVIFNVYKLCSNTIMTKRNNAKILENRWDNRLERILKILMYSGNRSFIGAYYYKGWLDTVSQYRYKTKAMGQLLGIPKWICFHP